MADKLEPVRREIVVGGGSIGALARGYHHGDIWGLLPQLTEESGYVLCVLSGTGVGTIPEPSVDDNSHGQITNGVEIVLSVVDSFAGDRGGHNSYVRRDQDSLKRTLTA